MVIYLTPGSFAKGGISRYTRAQITALRELVGSDRVRVYSVLGRGPNDLETSFEVDWCAGGVSPRRKLSYAAKVVADVARFRPRVVLAAHVNLSGLGVGISRLLRARSVLNVYGLEVWSGMRRDAAWGLRAADLVIADCHFTMDYIKSAGLRPSDARTRVAWDCVDTERFQPADPPASVLARYGIPDPSAHFNVLTLGRMTSGAAHKGYDRLLEACSRAVPGAPSLRLIYAGDGDLVDGLRARSASAGIADRVVFTGSIHEDDLPDVYRSCHVFSLVSDRGVGRGEGIPLTPLEAAACGKPILVGKQDGSQEAVIDGQNGYLLDPFDIATHAERLVELANNRRLRERLGGVARARILETHDYRVFRETMRSCLADVGVESTGSVDAR